MKKVILLLLSACSIFACTHTPKWELVWEDNFDGAEPDTSVWSRIPRGKPDWQNTQSFDDRCYEMRNGLLILKGIVNGVDFWPDSLVFHVNGKRNFVYPRIETEQEGQFPFNIPQYLLIDMQLGGSWVGTVDPADLPVEMEVDWVRHYQWK